MWFFPVQNLFLQIVKCAKCVPSQWKMFIPFLPYKLHFFAVTPCMYPCIPCIPPVCRVVIVPLQNVFYPSQHLLEKKLSVSMHACMSYDCSFNNSITLDNLDWYRVFDSGEIIRDRTSCYHHKNRFVFVQLWVSYDEAISAVCWIICGRRVCCLLLFKLQQRCNGQRSSRLAAMILMVVNIMMMMMMTMTMMSFCVAGG